MIGHRLAFIIAAALLAVQPATAQTTKRIKDLPAATSSTVGDVMPIDGATLRGITVENLFKENLVAIKGLVTAADRLQYWTGFGTAALTNFTTFGRSIAGLADAAAARTLFGVAIGSNVQAWDADLDCLAALATTGVLKRTGAGTCSAGAVALADLATGTQNMVIGYFGSTAASAISLSNCTTALTYSTSTNTFGCAAGAVSSVAAGTGMSFATITSSGSVAIDKATSGNLEAGTANKVLTADIIYDAETTLTHAASMTWDFSTFLNARQTLTGNVTALTCSNIKASQSGAISLVQDTTGSRTMVAAWCSQFRWANGVRGVLSTASNAVDALFYQCVSTTICYVSLAKAQAN